MGTQYETQYEGGQTPDHISSEIPGRTKLGENVDTLLDLFINEYRTGTDLLH